MLIRIWQGLDITVTGAPAQEISEGPEVMAVALLGQDYVGLKPRLLVDEGDRVRLGQPLFTDRRCPEIKFTSPGAGVVEQINRGERRSLQSVVVRLEDDHGDDGALFDGHCRDDLPGLGRDLLVEKLLSSGLWTAFRTRPYGKVADPGTVAHSIFITAIESDPLAAQADVIINASRQDFQDGLAVIPRLTPGPVYLCERPGVNLPHGNPERITVAEFSGRHPAGLPGTHIHVLDPVGRNRTVWYLDYQDVIAVGRLLTTGRLPTERVVALGGPLVSRPRLVRTRAGAATDPLVAGEVPHTRRRVISGSVLSGRTAEGPTAYLGRYHRQVSVIVEVGGGRRGRFSTALHGSAAAFVPTPAFERVMPLDMLPVPLLRALIVGDTDRAEALGCLELDEEDLALLSYVCPGKHDYGPLLRSVLARIEKEG